MRQGNRVENDGVRFGERMRRARKAARLKPEEAADALNVSRSQYYKYESGETLLAAVDLLKVSKILGVSTTYLLADDSIREVEAALLSRFILAALNSADNNVREGALSRIAENIRQDQSYGNQAQTLGTMSQSQGLKLVPGGSGEKSLPELQREIVNAEELGSAAQTGITSEEQHQRDVDAANASRNAPDRRYRGHVPGRKSMDEEELERQANEPEEE